MFPEAFAQGYLLKDARTSVKQGLRQRRIECKASGAAFSIRPSFVLPYMTGKTEDVEKALFLGRFGVPFWGLVHIFGKDPMYWYRLEVSLGRNSIVGTTVRQADLPEHLLADEHHQALNGAKVYIATTVGAGCCLGAATATTTTGFTTFLSPLRWLASAANTPPKKPLRSGGLKTAPPPRGERIGGGWEWRLSDLEPVLCWRA